VVGGEGSTVMREGDEVQRLIGLLLRCVHSQRRWRSVSVATRPSSGGEILCDVVWGGLRLYYGTLVLECVLVFTN